MRVLPGHVQERTLLASKLCNPVAQWRLMQVAADVRTGAQLMTQLLLL